MDIEKLTKQELKRAAQQCLQKYQEVGGLDRPAYLLEAQMYLAELDRRNDSFISIRDLILELVVIFMIAWEIHEGNQQATVLGNQLNVLRTMQQNAVTQAQNDQAGMEKQDTILGNLQDATKATADTMKNLAGTSRKALIASNATADGVKTLQATSQAQLALEYDISLIVFWDDSKKQFHIDNTGHTSVVLAGSMVDGKTVFGPEMTLVPNVQGDLAVPALTRAIESLPKSQSRNMRIILYLKNAKQEEFTLEQNVDIYWEGDKVSVRTQTLSIKPDHWSKARK